VTELIPYIEKQFRAIAAPHGRLLTGGSAGGLESLALQLHYADFFGGLWSFCPAEIDFRRYYSIDVYEDENAYLFAPADIIGRSFYQEWRPTERILFRTVEGQPGVTVRQLRELESVLGSRGRGALWFDPSEATYGPVGREGYPTHFFDPQTGRIDRTVADHWRNYDLRDYAEKNLPRLGPLLKGKLHFYVGDMDEYFGNLDVLLFEDFVKKTAGPDYPAIFMYGRPGKGHMWTPMTHAQLVRTMAEHVARKGESQAEHMLTQGDRAAIDALLASQQKAWNEGNLPGFLEAYAHSDALTFFGSHGASKGWTAVRDQYEKGCRNCRSRGTLVLSTFDMRSLGPDSAMVLGHWSLQREQGKVGGVFTLVLGRFAEGWRIIHDHTSGVPSAQSQ
jgi:uncharacterized protein (TIGR02246 family)